jgi:dipeptidyl aminopeptidase/acylaminoacyl peptidase
LPELLTLKADDGSDFYARIIKPWDFDSTKKYPVVVYVYGGPICSWYQLVMGELVYGIV